MNDKIKMATIYTRFGSHMETDNANRLAHPQNLYIPGFQAFYQKKERLIKTDKTKMNAVASFPVSHEDGQDLTTQIIMRI